MTGVNLSRLTWPAVVVIVAVLGVFCALSLSGVDTGNMVQIILTLAGLGGLGLHQAARLDTQDNKLDKITEQTNGVLTKRIKDGAGAAIRDELRKIGYPIPDEPKS